MNKKVLSMMLLSVFLACAIMFSVVFTQDVSAAYPSWQRVNFISAMVTAPNLNVRSGPSTKMNIIGVFSKNKWVNVLAKIGDWYAVYDPDSGLVGCVSGQYLSTATGTGTTGQAAVATPAPTPPQTVKTPTTPTTGITADEQKLLDLINKERAAAGIGALKADLELMKVARDKAADMVENNYFSHNSPTFGSPFDMMRAYGVSFKTAGENLAGNNTIEGAVKAWMNSEGHRKNILNGSFNLTGIGIVKSPKYGYVYVQMFMGR